MKVYTAFEAGRDAIARCLRDVCRAQQWACFLKTGSKAAVAVGHLRWRDVEHRAALAAKLCDHGPVHLRSHVRTVTVDHWISEARWL